MADAWLPFGGGGGGVCVCVIGGLDVVKVLDELRKDMKLALRCGLTPACLPGLVTHNPLIAEEVRFSPRLGADKSLSSVMLTRLACSRMQLGTM